MKKPSKQPIETPAPETPLPEQTVGFEFVNVKIVGPCSVVVDYSTEDSAVVVKLDPVLNESLARVIRAAHRRGTTLCTRILASKPGEERLAFICDLEDCGPDGLLSVRCVYLEGV